MHYEQVYCSGLSKREDQHVPEHVKICMDSSAHNGQVGTTATICHPRKANCTLHYLGLAEEHTVYEAGLAGILGLYLVKTEQARNTSFAIGADNQAVVKAILMELTHPGQHLAAAFLSMAVLVLWWLWLIVG
jgi:hypothetical protein